jgi:peroxiredoxin
MRSTWFVAEAAIVLGLLGGSVCGEALTAAKLGQKIANVEFVDRAGQKSTLQELKGKKAVVAVFLSFECPISTSYSPLLSDLAKRYADRGVAVVGICCNDGETPESVAKQAEQFKLGFPVYYDGRGVAVAAFKAEKTPEAFVLDHNFVLRYRGRIDDGYAARLKKNLQIKSHDLEAALDEVLGGKAVSKPITEVVGCAIIGEREVKRDGRVTYYRDVVPILQVRCQECHRPDQVGPFSLMTFKQAVTWAQDIKDYTTSRQMPPWKITTGIPFQHERRLSDKEIATLAAWVDEGTPEGNPSDAPPPARFVEGWQLGKPDVILSTTEDFIVGPGGRDLFRVFVLPTNLKDDRYVVAYEVKPGNPRVVHHTLNFIDTKGEGRRIEERAKLRAKDRKDSDVDCGPGYSVAMGVGFDARDGLGGWAPGQRPQPLPEGYGFFLPKGSDLVVQVHYHRNGRIERDRLQIGLYFAKKSDGMKAYKGGVIAGRFFAIPPDDPKFKVTGSTAVTHECVLRSIMPHMHLLGREIKVTLKRPQGPTQTLLEIGNWDYNWQETYFLKEPIKLAVGSVLNVEAIYDNSDGNTNNPNNPPLAVTFGEQTTNEMCFVFLGATSDGAGRSPFGRPFGDRNALRRLRERQESLWPKKKPAKDQAATKEPTAVTPPDSAKNPTGTKGKPSNE